MKYIITYCMGILLLLSGCSVDRLAILIRQYKSGELMTEKTEKLERKFISAKEQFAADKNKIMLVLYIEALTYEKRKNYTAALNIFNQITNLNDSILDVWLHIAQINHLLNNTCKAREAYLTCSKLIDREVAYIEKSQWPDNHILTDDHIKYAIRYSMIDNSYLPTNSSTKNGKEIDWADIKKNLLLLKATIKNSIKQLKILE